MKSDLYQKLLQLFILGYKWISPSKEFSALIQDGLGGVIFFAENLKNRNDFIQTVQSIKNQAKILPFLSIDQEGGLVERTIFLDKKIEYLTPKALSRLSQADIKTHYDIMTKDLASMGLNLNFAPVVDVNSNPKNPIIGVRSFGNTPDIVNKNAKTVINSFKENNIISCAKHYPGHGDTSTDSHKVMPYIDMDFEEFNQKHLCCFKEAINNNVDTIMVSHIHFSFFDKMPTPASLSKNAINYLKNELKFKGIIFSDDMVMGGISENYGLKESIILALKAGIDMLIFRNLSKELLCAIQEISKTDDDEIKQLIEKAYKKIIRFKNEKLKNNSPYDFDTEKNQKIIDTLAAKTIYSNQNIIPIKKDEPVVIVSFDNKDIFNLSYFDTRLSNFLNGYNLREIIYPLNPTREDIEKITKNIHNNDTVIFLSYNPTINTGQAELFKSIAANKKMLVHCGNASDTATEANVISMECYKPFCLKSLANLFKGI